MLPTPHRRVKGSARSTASSAPCRGRAWAWGETSGAARGRSFPSRGTARSSCRRARSPAASSPAARSGRGRRRRTAGRPAAAASGRRAPAPARPPRTPARPRIGRRRRWRAGGAAGSRCRGSGPRWSPPPAPSPGGGRRDRCSPAPGSPATSSGWPIRIDCSSATRSRRSPSTFSAAFTVASGRGMRRIVASRMMTIRSRMRVMPMTRTSYVACARRKRAPAPRPRAAARQPAGTKTTIGEKSHGSDRRNVDETWMKPNGTTSATPGLGFLRAGAVCNSGQSKFFNFHDSPS